MDEIRIQPVTLTSDFSFKLAVGSMLMKYALLQASVEDNIVTLQGDVEKKALPHLLKAIYSLQPKSIKQQLVSE